MRRGWLRSDSRQQTVHGDVVRQHRGGEAAHATVVGRLGQARHQLRGQALVLEPVADDDRELGRPRIAGKADVASDSDDRFGVIAQAGRERRHQRIVIAAVDLDQVAHVGFGQLGLGGQKPPVARLGRQPSVRGPQARAVVGANRPDLDFGATGQM